MDFDELFALADQDQQKPVNPKPGERDFYTMSRTGYGGRYGHVKDALRFDALYDLADTPDEPETPLMSRRTTEALQQTLLANQFTAPFVGGAMALGLIDPVGPVAETAAETAAKISGVGARAVEATGKLATMIAQPVTEVLKLIEGDKSKRPHDYETFEQFVPRKFDEAGFGTGVGEIFAFAGDPTNLIGGETGRALGFGAKAADKLSDARRASDLLELAQKAGPEWRAANAKKIQDATDLLSYGRAPAGEAPGLGKAYVDPRYPGAGTLADADVAHAERVGAKARAEEVRLQEALRSAKAESLGAEATMDVLPDLRTQIARTAKRVTQDAPLPGAQTSQAVPEVLPKRPQEPAIAASVLDDVLPAPQKRSPEGVGGQPPVAPSGVGVEDIFEPGAAPKAKTEGVAALAPSGEQQAMDVEDVLTPPKRPQAAVPSMVSEAAERRTTPVGGVFTKPSAPTATTGGKVMSPSQMSNALAELTNTLVSTKGNVNDPAVRGFYRNFAKDVTVRSRADFGTVAHEIAHRLEDLLFKPPGSPAQRRLKGTAFAKWANELDKMATPATSASSPTSEGFAEFVRKWLTDPTAAQTEAPKFFREFPTLLASASPDLARHMAKLQASVQMSRSARPIDQISALIVNADAKAMPLEMNPVESAIYRYIDDLSPLRKVVRDVAKHGKVAPGWNPVLLAEEMRNTPAKLDVWYGRLKEVVEETGNDPKMLSSYVYAERVLARDRVMRHRAAQLLQEARQAAASGDARQARALKKQADELRYTLPNAFDVAVTDPSSPQAQKAIRKSFEAAVASVPQNVKDVANSKLKDLTDDFLDTLSDGGLFSADEVAQMRALNPLYLPMQREIVEGATRGKKGSLGFMKRAKLESTADIVNPVEQFALNVHAGLRRVKENEVHLALAKMATDNPDIAKVARIIPGQVATMTKRYGLQGIADAMGISVEDLAKKAGMSVDELDNTVSVFQGSYRPSKDAPPTLRRVLNKAGVSGKRPVPEIDSDDFWIEVSPEIAAALERAPSGIESAAAFAGMASAARVFRFGVTQNPVFAYTNLIRDIMGSQVTSRAQRIPLYDAIANAIGGALSTAKRDEYYRIAADSGALTTGADEVLRDVRRFASEASGSKFKNAIGRILQAVTQDIAEASESIVRVGEVKALIKRRGWDPKNLTRAQRSELGEAGREVGPVFTRRGANMAAVNSLTPFLNATVQGWRSFADGVRRRPLYVSMVTLSTAVAPSLILWAANKDESWYQDLTEDQRREYWHFRVGGRTYKLPKPHGIGLLATATERTLDHIAKKRPGAAQEISDMVLAESGKFVPLSSNPIMKLLMESVSGIKVDDIGQQLGHRVGLTPHGPQSVIPRGLQKGESRLQAYPTQGKVSEKAADFLSNLIPGGVSPIALERNVRTIGGTLGQSALEGANWLASIGDDKRRQFDIKDLPGIGRLTEREVPYTTDAGEKFYDLYERAKKSLETLEILANRSPEEAEAYANKHARDLEMWDTLESVMKEDRAYRKAINDAKTSAPEEVDELQRERNAFLRETMKELQRVQ